MTDSARDVLREWTGRLVGIAVVLIFGWQLLEDGDVVFIGIVSAFLILWGVFAVVQRLRQ